MYQQASWFTLGSREVARGIGIRVFRPREIVRIDRAAGMGQSARRKRAIEKEQQTGKKTNARRMERGNTIDQEQEEEGGEKCMERCAAVAEEEEEEEKIERSGERRERERR